MASINNAYPETYKIELVKRYLNGEMQKNIVKEHNIAKSTFYSWVCKYSSLILQKWKIGKEVEVSEDNTFVDIRRACETSIKTSVVQGSKDIVRIFVDGFAIICDISQLNNVLEVLNHD